MNPKYPEITVKLSGEDGNAFSMIGRTSLRMRAGGVSKEEIEAFTEEATSGDYDNAIQTIMKTVNVE